MLNEIIVSNRYMIWPQFVRVGKPSNWNELTTRAPKKLRRKYGRLVRRGKAAKAVLMTSRLK